MGKHASIYRYTHTHIYIYLSIYNSIPTLSRLSIFLSFDMVVVLQLLSFWFKHCTINWNNGYSPLAISTGIADSRLVTTHTPECWGWCFPALMILTMETGWIVKRDDEQWLTYFCPNGEHREMVHVPSATGFSWQMSSAHRGHYSEPHSHLEAIQPGRWSKWK